ncbi:MAG: division plane positioning ATPase MipZ [Thiotrichales bacterium]
MITLIGSLKGGTGKSTLTFNMSVWLATQGFTVKIFDLDPQATLVDVVTIRTEEGYQPTLSVDTNVNNIRNEKGVQTLIDVGTANMAGMEQAIFMADRIIIPVPPSQADVWSTQRFIRIVKEACARREKKPELLAFINRADTNPAVRETAETLDALSRLPGLRRVVARLGQRTTFRRSFSEGLAVFELEPSGKASAELNALAMVLFSSLFIEG